MDPRVYDRIINTCVLLVVLSALVFERAGRFGWLVGMVAIIAGVATVCVYFVNQSRNRSRETGIDDSKTENHDESSDKPNQPTVGDMLSSAENTATEPHEHFGMPVFLPEESSNFVVRTTMHRHLQQRHYRYVYLAAKVQSPESRFVDHVVEIVDKLCTTKGGRSLEFVLSPDGSFVIRQTRRAPDWSQPAQEASEKEVPHERLASERVQ